MPGNLANHKRECQSQFYITHVWKKYLDKILKIFIENGSKATWAHSRNQRLRTAQIQIPIQQKYLGYEYKRLVFIEIINGKHGKGTHLGPDCLVKNTPNTPKFTGPSTTVR